MTPTLTAPEFAADVLAFAAERGVGDYLLPLYELAKSCFDGADVAVRVERDGEIADLGWVVFDVTAPDWDRLRLRTAKDQWRETVVATLPADARQPFVVAVR